MAAAQEWTLRLFRKSVLKQRKLREISRLLGSTTGLHCLDIGGDNGVISYLLRQKGGSWKSADLEESTVAAIRSLVGAEVYRIDGGPTPFAVEEFDIVVVIDFLEHIPGDAAFIRELFRILRPGGTLILNVPHDKGGLLRRLRHTLGQTDEQHGHLRPGYRLEDLHRLLGTQFVIEHHHTYSRFFSELLDTLIVAAVSRLGKKNKSASRKGLVVTEDDLQANRKLFRLYSLLYPFFWAVAQLDRLLFFTSGYMLILRARVEKRAVQASGGEILSLPG